MRTALALLPLLLTLGCNSNEDIWLLQMPFVTDPTCDTTVTHNFTGAYEPTDTTESDWTIDETSDKSPALVFVQISMESKDAATLLMGNQAWPGTSPDKDHWKFSWTGSNTADSNSDNVNGYTFTESRNDQSVETIDITFDGSTATGTWETDTNQDDQWSETDEWDTSVGLSAGQIPANLYLVVDTSTTTGMPVRNAPDFADCDAANCSLKVQATCTESRDFTGTLTGYTTEDAYQQLVGAGQPYGT